MENQVKTKEQLIAVINFMLWNYDEYCAVIKDAKATVEVVEHARCFDVKINYIVGIKKGSGEGPTQVDDETNTCTEEFTLLKLEGFKQLNKYVEDICDSISKVEVYK